MSGNNNQTIQIVTFSEKLPSISMVVCNVLEKYVRRKFNSKSGRDRIHVVATAVRNYWISIFGNQNVKSINSVKTDVLKCMKVYQNNVNVKGFNVDRFTQWRQAYDTVLFDILKKGAELTERQKIFYDDQCTDRVMVSSDAYLYNDFNETPEPIPEPNVNDDEEQMECELHPSQMHDNSDYDSDNSEDSFSSDSDSVDESNVYMQTRSGKVIRNEENESEDKKESFPQIPLRKVRNFSHKLHKTLIQMTSEAHLSISQVLIAFRVSANEFFNQDYKNEIELELKQGRPVTHEDYQKYCNVLPSWPSVSLQRHNYALCKKFFICFKNIQSVRVKKLRT